MQRKVMGFKGKSLSALLAIAVMGGTPLIGTMAPARAQIDYLGAYLDAERFGAQLRSNQRAARRHRRNKAKRRTNRSYRRTWKKKVSKRRYYRARR